MVKSSPATSFPVRQSAINAPSGIAPVELRYAWVAGRVHGGRTDMTLQSIAAVGSLFLIVAADTIAANVISSTASNDIVIGTDDDDEIRGFDGDDELRGGAGNDILIGGLGSDILFGGSGADNFLIEFLKDVPDEIMDFRPEEGDTFSLRLPDTEQSEIKANSFRVDRKGMVTFQLRSGQQIEAVKLNRSDLSLQVDGIGKEIRLIFAVKF